MNITTSIDELKLIAASRDSHFFDASAMRFFNSRVHSRIYGGHFFVTSEKRAGVYSSSGWIPGDPRAYTVREIKWEGSHISFDAVGEGFQGYATRSEAHTAARQLAAQLWTFDDEEVLEITSAALDCLVWSETVIVGDSDEPIEADSLGLDFSAEAIDTMTGKVRSFLALCAEGQIPVRLVGDLGQIGHDLVLTMNRNGTGFWDRGNGALGTLLTHWADSLGNISVWVRESEDGDMLEIER